jgi:hypothetical protein
LRRDPAERYASMAALRDDLTNLESVQIPQYASSTSGRPRIARDRLLNATIVVVAFMLLAVIGVIAQFAHSAKGPP